MAVVVTSQNQQGAFRLGEVPDLGQRHTVGQHVSDQSAEQPHLDISVGQVDALKVNGVVEDVRGADRWLSIAVNARVGGVALSVIGNAAGEIIGPCGSCLVAHHRWIGGGGGAITIDLGNTGCP